MNLRRELRRRFEVALRAVAADSPLQAAEIDALLDLVVPSQDPKFGDYQANLAMPLGKRLKLPPRDVAGRLIEHLAVDDLCQPPEIAGPGFINLRLRDPWLIERLGDAVADSRLAIAPAAEPRTYVVDFSAPNVAKPMHVGHIRSTVIGDALYRTLKFLGHRVIGDNHIGDWGTQFGMIIYGFKHLRDEAAYRQSPVDELARLYRLVNQLVDYFECREQLPQAAALVAEKDEQLAAAVAAHQQAADKESQKQADKARRRAQTELDAVGEQQAALEAKVAAVEKNPTLAQLAAQHPDIGARALEETALLHAGDAENLRLWREFLPPCLEALEAVYRRLHVAFDETLGESFYHDRLAAVVDDLLARQLARTSDGAVCVFIDDSDVPMIVRKKDGAFLYATTDLATIQYRMETWRPDAILYVVDHRQSDHFKLLFATARLWGYHDVELQHISFGTVLGEDKRPYKTRSGDTVGLTSLLDEAVERALAIVSENDDAKPDGPELSAEQRAGVAEVVGLGALKYADLSHNRTSDYVFSYDKMLAMKGNTATYMQYAYARVRSIFRRGEVDVLALRAAPAALSLAAPAERALAIELLRFGEALDAVVQDYRPNQLTSYLFDLANRYSTFFDQCPVLKAETPELRASRLLLCDLTARTLKQGLELLGIEVAEQM